MTLSSSKIPKDWITVKLGELGAFGKGKGIKKDEVKPDGKACIRYGELYTHHHEYIKKIHSYIDEKTAKHSHKISKGDILFAGSGETKEEIGKCAAFIGEQETFAGGDVIVFTPRNSDSLFLGFLLNHESVARQKAQYGQGDAVVHIYPGNLREIIVSLPSSKAEQTAIATALSDADALITALEKLIEKKRNIKQGVMQELLRPKEGWKMRRLGELCEIYGRIGFRGYTAKDIVSQGNGAITISPSNIIDHKIDFSECTYISWHKYNESPEIQIFNEDILLVKTGSTFGKTAIVKNLPLQATINPQLVVLKRTSLNRHFLAYMMSFKTIQDQIKEAIVGGAIPTLSQKMIAGFILPTPDKAEQDRIAQILVDIDSDLEALENKVHKQRLIKKGMMQELLAGKTRLI